MISRSAAEIRHTEDSPQLSLSPCLNSHKNFLQTIGHLSPNLNKIEVIRVPKVQPALSLHLRWGEHPRAEVFAAGGEGEQKGGVEEINQVRGREEGNQQEQHVGGCGVVQCGGVRQNQGMMLFEWLAY